MSEHSAPLDPADTPGLVDRVRQRLDEGGVPGATLAALRDGDVVIEMGVGYRDLPRTTPIDHDARFYIYSITKLFIATATLRLAEASRLALDAPVQDVLPNLSLAEPVTLRQLLNHTGGVPDYGGMPTYFEAVRAAPGHPWTSDEFLERTLARGWTFAPGHGWAYSNIGFLLVRLALERLTGQSLHDLLREQIWAPLELARTSVAEALADAGALTPAYSAFFRSDGAVEDVARAYHPGWVSHGVAISTAGELARSVHAIFSGWLFSPASLASMLDTVRVPGNPPGTHEPAYGLGVMVDRLPEGWLLAGHAGGGPGYSAAAFSLVDGEGHRITVAALLNQDDKALAAPIAIDLARALARP